MLWNGLPRTADRIISQAQYWLIASFPWRNWERGLQASGTFRREIKVVHLLRNASGNGNGVASRSGTEKMKGEQGEKEKIPAFIPLVYLAGKPGVPLLLIRLENVPMAEIVQSVKKIICREFFPHESSRASRSTNT